MYCSMLWIFEKYTVVVEEVIYSDFKQERYAACSKDVLWTVGLRD